MRRVAALMVILVSALTGTGTFGTAPAAAAVTGPAHRLGRPAG
jgi:hypothetical protein